MLNFSPLDTTASENMDGPQNATALSTTGSPRVRAQNCSPCHWDATKHVSHSRSPLHGSRVPTSVVHCWRVTNAAAIDLRAHICRPSRTGQVIHKAFMDTIHGCRPSPTAVGFRPHRRRPWDAHICRLRALKPTVMGAFQPTDVGLHRGNSCRINDLPCVNDWI